jgi:transcriptional regulator with XRE-family HTH domain
VPCSAAPPAASRCSGAACPRGGRRGTPALPFCHHRVSTQKPKEGYPEVLNTPGDHVRTARLDRGLTQKQLAELLEVTSSTINNWERGRSTPALQTLPKLVSFLGYDPAMDGGAPEVARMRRPLGLTRETFAVRLGVDPSTLARWERRERAPSLAHEVRIADLVRRSEAS